jgi:hypothetical protein
VWYPTPWMRNTICLSIFFLITHKFIRINRIWFQICVCLFYLSGGNFQKDKYEIQQVFHGDLRVWAPNLLQVSRLKISQRGGEQLI